MRNLLLLLFYDYIYSLIKQIYIYKVFTCSNLQVYSFKLSHSLSLIAYPSKMYFSIFQIEIELLLPDRLPYYAKTPISIASMWLELYIESVLLCCICFCKIQILSGLCKLQVLQLCKPLLVMFLVMVSPSSLLAKSIISGLHFMYIYDWSRRVVLHVKQFIYKIVMFIGSRVQQSRQISLEESDVSPLQAIFWAKLAGSSRGGLISNLLNLTTLMKASKKVSTR